MSTTPKQRAPLVEDERYHRAFDVERAAVLRRRIVIYCGVALALVLLSLLGVLGDFAHPYYDDGTPIRTQWMDLLSDLLLASCFGVTGVLVWSQKPSRGTLVRVVTLLTLLVGVGASVFELLTRRAEPDIASGMMSHTRAVWVLTRLAAADFLVFHGLVSLLIPMRLREQIRLAAPCWMGFAVVSVLAVPAPISIVQVVFIALFPALLVPGVLWSTWRYREFDAKSVGREIASRFGEVTEELNYARRIHEALFPPQIERGPVRVRYRYEPMREIGGDFLFVHPVAFPPSEHAGPVSVVLIDVSGHGVPAALAVNRLHGELQRLFASDPALRPAALIAALNHYTFASLAPQGVFATACALRIDPGAGELAWSSAGHPPAFVRRASGEVAALDSTAMMLGVLDAAGFDGEEVTLPIGPGDTVLAYTDGATESRSEQGEEFSIPRVRDLVAAGSARATLAHTVMDGVREFRRGVVDDDTLIVEVSFAGPAGPA